MDSRTARIVEAILLPTEGRGSVDFNDVGSACTAHDREQRGIKTIWGHSLTFGVLKIFPHCN